MHEETNPPVTTEPPEPVPASTGSRWRRRAVALAGVAALGAAALGFGTAGAQTDNGDDAPEVPPAVVHAGVVSVGPFGPGDMTAFDECLAEALPDDGFSIEALPVEPLDEGTEIPEPSPEELESLDIEFETALEQCERELSDGERAEMDAWKDFDECIDGQFDDLGTIVTIDGDDGLTVGSFGEDAGTITIAKAADGSISVEVDGSGSVADGSDAEEQFLLPDDGACEHLLPQGADA